MDSDVLIVGARADRAHARHRSRQARRALHADRAESAPGVSAEDGTHQCAHHGNLPPHGLGAANPRRRACGPIVPMDVYIMLALNEPPLLHLPYPSVAQAQAETRASNDGSAAARALSADLAIYARAAVEIDRRDASRRSPCGSAASFCRCSRTRDGVTARVRGSDGGDAGLRAAYLVGCDGGTSPVRKELGIELSGEGNLLALRQALYRCDELFDRLPIGNGPGKGRHYHVADDKATQLIMQDSTKHWTLHSIVDSDEEMNRRVRAHRRRSGQIRDAVLRSVAAESPACRPLRQRPRLPRRRCGASRHPDRRARHEFRRRRRHRSVVEACRDACRLGRPAAAASPTRSSAARSASAMSAPRATPRSAGANGARCGGRIFATIRRPAQQTRHNLSRRRRYRAAQEQRDDRRRARLSLCQLTDHLQYAGRSRASVPRISSDHLAGRAAAARLARRRHADAGPHPRRLHDPQTRPHQGRLRAGSKAPSARAARR